MTSQDNSFAKAQDIESTFGKTTREAIAKRHRTHLCKGYCKNTYKESSKNL
jgi:hypothetical protein